MSASGRDAARAQAETLVSLRRHDDAAALLARHFARDPTDVDALVLLARVRIAQGRPEQALDTLDDALAQDPARPVDALVARVDALLALDRAAAASMLAERAVGFGPERVDAHWSKLRAELAMGRTADARDTAVRIAALVPDWAAAHAAPGLVALADQRWRDAERCFRRAVAVAPDRPALLHNLGVAIANQGRHREAADLFERAGHLEPRFDTIDDLARSAGNHLAVGRDPPWARSLIVVALALVAWGVVLVVLVALGAPPVAFVAFLLAPIPVDALLRARRRRHLSPAAWTAIGVVERRGPPPTGTT